MHFVQKGILQSGSTGQMAMGLGGGGAIENQEFWVPRYNPRDQMMPAPGLWRSAWLRKKQVRVAPFQTLLVYFKGKLTSRSKR